MQLIPNLVFNGQCEEAFKFYEKVLGGKIVAMLTPETAPTDEFKVDAWRNKVLHACLAVGDELLMGGDAPTEWYEQPKGTSVTIQIGDPAEAERIFRELAENGTVRMPLEETFWAIRFGMVVDRFGTPWIINCGKPE
jgi:PhnB protein